MCSFVLAVYRRYQLACVLAAVRVLLALAAPAYGESGLTPHPSFRLEGQYVSQQLGNFGESVVVAGLRARGYEALNANVGGNGIDVIAYKRNPDGKLLDLRFVEVKTRQDLATFDLSTTKRSGRQLSAPWTNTNLVRLTTSHPDPQVRKLASEIIAETSARPSIVQRELHGIVLASDRYCILTVDASGKLTGQAADGRLTSVLRAVAKRGSSQATRELAQAHLMQFESLRQAGGKLVTLPKPVAVSVETGVAQVTQRVSTPATRVVARPPRAVVFRDGESAQLWARTLPLSPGVLAAGATFVVDEGAALWEYNNGEMSAADFQRRSVENGAKAAFVGVATQVLYLIAVTPHGTVVVGVVVVAYLAADAAVAAYNDAFVPKAPLATELRGLAPDRCIGIPMMGDVASGTVRLRRR